MPDFGKSPTYGGSSPGRPPATTTDCARDVHSRYYVSLLQQIQPFAHALHDVPLLLFLQLRIDRQCDQLPAGPFGFRVIARPVPECYEAFLEMQRNRIVNFSADALFFEIVAQGIPLRHGHHELVVDVIMLDPILLVDGARQANTASVFDLGLLEQGFIEISVFLPQCRPTIQVGQLDAQHRRLQSIEPKVPADDAMVVLRLAALYSQHLQPFGKFLIVRDDHAAIAQTTEILAGKK